MEAIKVYWAQYRQSFIGHQTVIMIALIVHTEVEGKLQII